MQVSNWFWRSNLQPQTTGRPIEKGNRWRSMLLFMYRLWFTLHIISYHFHIRWEIMPCCVVVVLVKLLVYCSYV